MTSKFVLLTLTAIFLGLSLTLPKTVAQESITITEWGCSSCSQEHNTFWVNWIYTGTIPFVSIYYYNLSMTTIEYTVVENTANLGAYEWNMPASHTLYGYYYLVVCDSSNHNVNDTRLTEVYSIEVFPSNIPGFPTLSIGLIVGITSAIVAISLTKKLRKR